VVIARHRGLGNVAPGELVTLSEREAMDAELAGCVRIVSGTFMPQDVQAAGGMKAWLEKDAKNRKMSEGEVNEIRATYDKQGLVPPAPSLDYDEQV